MATRSIILNRNNIVSNTNNTVLRYNFAGTQSFSDQEICVASIQMYNSVFNIDTQLYNNNSFTYTFHNATGTGFDTFSVVIPDGYYSTNDLNEYFVSVMDSRGHFIQNNTTRAKTYYYTILDNVNRYAVQLVCSKLPSTADLTGSTRGSTTWTAPASGSATHRTGQITFLTTNNFHLILGFAQQSYPSSPSTASSFNALSSVPPVQQPVSSILLTCNLVENPLSNPSNLLTSFTINQAEFGAMAIINPNNLIWQPCSHITGASYLELRMLDQDFRPFKIQDNQMLFNILIKEKEKK